MPAGRWPRPSEQTVLCASMKSLSLCLPQMRCVRTIIPGSLVWQVSCPGDCARGGCWPCTSSTRVRPLLGRGSRWSARPGQLRRLCAEPPLCLVSAAWSRMRRGRRACGSEEPTPTPVTSCSCVNSTWAVIKRAKRREGSDPGVLDPLERSDWRPTCFPNRTRFSGATRGLRVLGAVCATWAKATSQECCSV